MTTNSEPPLGTRTVLHFCKREVLRPLRDEILRISGLSVVSTFSREEALAMFHSGSFGLVLIDVEGEEGVPLAETLCTAVRKEKPEQLVAFVCNWRVEILTDCPDHVLRTEFDPAAFAAGVRKILANAQ